jgi:hypothetical protein
MRSPKAPSHCSSVSSSAGVDEHAVERAEAIERDRGHLVHARGF